MKIKKGEYVRIHSIVLEAGQRAPQVPEDTKKVPLECWTKGFLLEDQEMGDEVEVKTITGRIAKGTLIDVNHTYKHNYGNFVPELLHIGVDLRKILWGGEAHE